MLTKAQIETVRERLRYMHCEYRHYMNCDEREIGSNGLVATYKQASGGRTNRTSDMTAMAGMRRANIPQERLKSLRWIDCAWRVFIGGSAATLRCEAPSVTERQRRATISYVLYYKAFLGYTFARIAEMPMPSGRCVSRQRIHDFWEAAIVAVGEEAKREGLL